MIDIAPLRISDRDRWAQLWAAYQAFYQIALPASVTEATWTRLHDGRIHGLAARDAAGSIVGFVHFLYHQDTWSEAPACYLQDLYVDPQLRGAGCGRRLIEAVAAAAKFAGANPPYWLTHTTNAVARRLYDRIGTNAGFIHYTYVGAASENCATL